MCSTALTVKLFRSVSSHRKYECPGNILADERMQAQDIPRSHPATETEPSTTDVTRITSALPCRKLEPSWFLAVLPTRNQSPPAFPLHFAHLSCTTDLSDTAEFMCTLAQHPSLSLNIYYNIFVTKCLAHHHSFKHLNFINHSTPTRALPTSPPQTHSLLVTSLALPQLLRINLISSLTHPHPAPHLSLQLLRSVFTP